MTDIIDHANDRAEHDTARVVDAARARASSIPVGDPGECDLCGEWSGRLVDGHCAPCRDKYRLP
jgi:hypothetical protein